MYSSVLDEIEQSCDIGGRLISEHVARDVIIAFLSNI